MSEPSYAELVRGFVREAALAEDVSAALAAQLAADSADVWQALSTTATGPGPVHITISTTRRELRARIRLAGHSRFAAVVATLAGRGSAASGLSCHEAGVDGWEITLHRPLSDPGIVLAAAYDAPSAPKPAGQPGDVQIDLARMSDAPSIARCFLQVYGHHYVHPDVFSPRRYWARVEAGELIPVVARDARGEVIGHVALERDSGALVAERGEAAVLPDYRGQHLLERMTERLSEEAPRHGLQGLYAEPLTIHTFSQRNDVRAGMPVCAVLLGANPEDFRPKDIPCPTAGQRQSYLRTFRFVLPPAPRNIHLPADYRDIVLKIYDSLQAPVAVVTSSAPLPAASQTGLSVNDRGYGIIRFQQIGSNCAVELAQALRDTRSLGARSIQLSARLTDEGLPALAQAARALGFFFCGLGPGFAAGEDLMLMQYLSEPLDTSKLQLFTDEARQLVAFIDADRLAVAGRAS